MPLRDRSKDWLPLVNLTLSLPPSLISFICSTTVNYFTGVNLADPEFEVYILTYELLPSWKLRLKIS